MLRQQPFVINVEPPTHTRRRQTRTPGGFVRGLIRLAFAPPVSPSLRMGLPAHPVTLSPQEISDLNHKLSDARHNINNNLALVVASLELLRRKPDAMDRVIENLSRQPQKIVDEMREFTQRFEATLQITRD